MATVYVAGPVLRHVSEREIARSVTGVYDFLERVAAQANARILLPIAEPDLEIASAESLLETIVGRISKADKVITVFAPFDASGPIESAIAALLHKPQLIIALRKGEVPRMMRGLPGVADVLAAREIAGFLPRISDFFRS